jgi:Fe-S oxidoreductase
LPPTRTRSIRTAISTRASCSPAPIWRNAYTPSFGLLELESLIMEQSEIGAIADSIKDCLRCGKCKPVCNTHVPRANLLYSPRNKILATSLLIEAFLYEEQTRRGISLKHFDEFDDVADHCTVCHKCVNPCPVDIDFGDVTVAMRNFLNAAGKKKKRRPASWRWPSSTAPIRTPSASCARAPSNGAISASASARR